MAEGDTVHRTARRLHQWLNGRDLDRAAAPSPASPLRRQPDRLASLEGERVVLAEALGKHLLVHFSNGLALHSHLGMRGTWRTHRRSEPWGRPIGAAWIMLSAVDRDAAQFGGPRLGLRREREIRLDPMLRGLGPDVLGESFDPHSGVAALRRRAAGTDRLGEILVRQSAIAGIGNIYKSESLWEAQLDPWRRLSEIDDDGLESVLAAARRLMQAGVESGRQPRRIYRRAGQPCPRCGAPLRSSGQGDANRTTYWCPACQR